MVELDGLDFSNLTGSMIPWLFGELKGPFWGTGFPSKPETACLLVLGTVSRCFPALLQQLRIHPSNLKLTSGLKHGLFCPIAEWSPISSASYTSLRLKDGEKLLLSWRNYKRSMPNVSFWVFLACSSLWPVRHEPDCITLLDLFILPCQ